MLEWAFLVMNMTAPPMVLSVSWGGAWAWLNGSQWCVGVVERFTGGVLVWSNIHKCLESSSTELPLCSRAFKIFTGVCLHALLNVV